MKLTPGLPFCIFGHKRVLRARGNVYLHICIRDTIRLCSFTALHSTNIIIIIHRIFISDYIFISVVCAEQVITWKHKILKPDLCLSGNDGNISPSLWILGLDYTRLYILIDVCKRLLLFVVARFSYLFLDFQHDHFTVYASAIFS